MANRASWLLKTVMPLALPSAARAAFSPSFADMSVNQTSMEWGIINYDSKSEAFSEPGSVIADIYGCIGGMLTGGSGKAESPNINYATPFWWLLERIWANGFPNAHLNVVAWASRYRHRYQRPHGIINYIVTFSHQHSIHCTTGMTNTSVNSITIAVCACNAQPL